MRDILVYLDSGSLGVTSKFFEKYYRNSAFNDSLIFIGTCHGADDSYLADTLLSHGARTVLCFQNSVYTDYVAAMCSTLFSTLTQEDGDTGQTKTVSDALAQAQAVNGDTDTDTSSWWAAFKEALNSDHQTPAYLVIYGDSSLRLTDEDETETGTLSGKVLAAENSSEMSGVTLDFYRDGELEETIELDESDEGYYAVTLPEGLYKIVASAEGYEDFIAYAEVVSGETVYMESFMMVLSAEDSGTGKSTGEITDSVTAELVADVSLEVRAGWNNTGYTDVIYTTSSLEDGSYTAELPVGNYTVTAVKDGYIEASINIYIMENCTVYFQNISITPVSQEDTYRIVLTWGENPSDLDSHVEGTLSDGSSFHVFYGNKSVYDGDTEVCNLDVDDTTSYGPETITLIPQTSDPYYYYVYRFAGSGTVAESQAQVNVYRGDELLYTFNVPTDLGDGDYWNVFAIADGEIIIQNSVTDYSETDYADAAAAEDEN